METPRSRRSCCVGSSSSKLRDLTPTTDSSGTRATFTPKVTPSVKVAKRRASTVSTMPPSDSNVKPTPSRRTNNTPCSPVSRTPGRRILKRSSIIPTSTNDSPKLRSPRSSAENLGFGGTVLTSPISAPAAAKATPRRIFRSTSRATETKKLSKEEEFKDWYDLLDRIKESTGGQQAST